MEFSFTAEEEAFRQEVRSFLDKELPAEYESSSHKSSRRPLSRWGMGTAESHGSQIRREGLAHFNLA